MCAESNLSASLRVFCSFQQRVLPGQPHAETMVSTSWALKLGTEGHDKKKMLTRVYFRAASSFCFTTVPRSDVSSNFGTKVARTLRLHLTWNSWGNFTHFTPSWNSIHSCQVSSGSALTASRGATCASVTQWRPRWSFSARSPYWWGVWQTPSLEMACVATSRLLSWWRWVG